MLPVQREALVVLVHVFADGDDLPQRENRWWWALFMQWGLGPSPGFNYSLATERNTSALTLFTRQSYAAAKTEPAAAKKILLLQPPAAATHETMHRFTYSPYTIPAAHK